MSAPPVVILTGAGISAESGLATFRDLDGLWYDHRVDDVATPEGFFADPDRGHAFYNGLRRRLTSGEVRPNPAHLALADLERRHPGPVSVVTQNIDDLHERAGSRSVLHIHGELLRARCEECALVTPCPGDLTRWSMCGHCGESGRLRPHVVWFGEMPFHMPEVHGAIEAAGLFVAIGTSGLVYPAAGLVTRAKAAGAHTVEINLTETASSPEFDRRLCGRASEVVPRFVDELLAGGARSRTQ